MKKYVLIIALGLINCANYIPENNNEFWSEVRDGFKIKPENNPQIQRELNLYIKHKHNLEKSLAKAAPYLWYIKTQIKAQHLPTELILIPMIESEYQPFAYSWAGATGLWQMMPGTASGLGLTIDWWVDERRDIVKSTNAALKYLLYLNNFFNNNWVLAIASYDSGAGTVQKAIKKNNTQIFWKLTLPQETQRYIPKLFALQKIIANPSHYKVRLPKITNSPYFITIPINQSIALKDIAKLAKISTQQIRILNPSFRRWSTSPNRTHNIVIPASQKKVFLNNLKTFKTPTKHPKLKKHKIKSGENLYSLAKKYHTNKQQILEINQLKSTNIKAGKTILLPKKQTILLPGFTHHQSKQINAEHKNGPKKTIYICKKHDTVEKISKKLKIKSSELIYWNQIKSTLKPGKHLVIWKRPPKIPKTYKVVAGDSIIKIAKKFKISKNKIIKINHLKQNIIRINQELKLR